MTRVSVGSADLLEELVTPVSLPSVSVPRVSVPSVAPGALPVTGGDLLMLVLIALAPLTVGGGMTVIGRRALTKA
jgi:hypothetical protein